MTNRTYTIGKYLFDGTESILSVHSLAYYRYAQARMGIQCMVESSVTWCLNVEGVRMHEIVIHDYAMTLHNRRALKSFRHASSSLMTLHNMRALKMFGHA